MKFATETEQKVAAKPLKLGLNYGGRVVESREAESQLHYYTANSLSF